MLSARFPRTTCIVLAGTAMTTALQFVIPGWLGALERRPGMLAAHEWWRLVTPLLVHDGGWRQIAFNFPAIAIVGTIVERLVGARRWLLLYFIAGVTGELAGIFWQPLGAGASVAGAGLLGALAVWMWTGSRPLQMRIGGAIILAGAITLTIMRDIHGPPILIGALLGHRDNQDAMLSIR